MDIHFNCPRCGQNLSVEERGAGMLVNCPRCKGQIEIPRGTAPQPNVSVPTIPQTTPPPLPPPPVGKSAGGVMTTCKECGQKVSSKATSCPACGAPVKRVRTKTRPLLNLVGIAVVALVVWLVYDSSKPKLLAKISVTSQALRITNGNDSAWDSPEIILNDGFGGPILTVAGTWAPNETRELSLADFQGRLNHQPFKPGYEKVREVMIQARGFRLGIYETHSQ